MSRWAPQLGLAAVASAGVTFGITQLVSGHRMQVAVTFAVLVPAAVARLSRRLPGWAASLVQVLIGLAGVGLVAGAGPLALTRGLSTGWSQVLSTTLPANPSAAVLVPLTALVWATSAATSLAVVRATAVFLPVLPVAGGAVAAQLLEGDNVGRSSFVFSCIGIAGLVALCGVRADAALELPGRGRGRLPVALLTLPAVLVATAVAVLAGSAIPVVVAIRDRPFDPRSLRAVAPAASDVDNPLAMVRAARRQRDGELAEVTTSSSADVAVYLRLVALDRYDGSTWSSTAQYRVAGTQLPRPAGGGPATVVVRQDVVVRALRTPWVAVADRPVRLQGLPVLYDPAQGTVVATADDPLHPDQRYRAESLVPQPDPSGLANAAADPAVALAPLRALPAGLAPAFEAEARAATDGAVGSDFARLAALQSYFTEGYAIQDGEAGGQSIAQLARFLAPDRRVAPSSAEFAAAFALLARTLGYASRVVVGFAPFPAGGARVLRRGDLHAWPEVALRGFGWVPFEPTPPDRAAPDRPAIPVPVDSAAALAAKVAAEQRAGSAGAPGVAPGPPKPAPSPARVSKLVSGLVAVLVAAALLLACPTVLKARRRRRRRRSADPVERVLGAWSEALDRLAERGVARDSAASARDVLGRTGSRLGPDVVAPVHELGQLATVAVCGPPGSVGASSGEGAWAAAARLARVLRRTGTRTERARAAIDPRALLRRAGR